LKGADPLENFQRAQVIAAQNDSNALTGRLGPADDEIVHRDVD